MEELKADNIEKDTRIVYLEGQISEFVSSLEKARGEAIAAFKKSDEHKKALDSHYAAGYEDFRVDAKETYPDLDFDFFKLPLAAESSLLLTSFEDVNILDDANNEVTQDSSKSGGHSPVAYLSNFIIYLYWKCPLFWALFLALYSSLSKYNYLVQVYGRAIQRSVYLFFI